MENIEKEPKYRPNTMTEAHVPIENARFLDPLAPEYEALWRDYLEASLAISPSAGLLVETALEHPAMPPVFVDRAMLLALSPLKTHNLSRLNPNKSKLSMPFPDFFGVPAGSMYSTLGKIKSVSEQDYLTWFFDLIDYQVAHSNVVYDDDSPISKLWQRYENSDLTHADFVDTLQPVEKSTWKYQIEDHKNNWKIISDGCVAGTLIDMYNKQLITEDDLDYKLSKYGIGDNHDFLIIGVDADDNSYSTRFFPIISQLLDLPNERLREWAQKSLDNWTDKQLGKDVELPGWLDKFPLESGRKLYRYLLHDDIKREWNDPKRSLTDERFREIVELFGIDILKNTDEDRPLTTPSSWSIVQIGAHKRNKHYLSKLLESLLIEHASSKKPNCYGRTEPQLFFHIDHLALASFLAGDLTNPTAIEIYKTEIAKTKTVLEKIEKERDERKNASIQTRNAQEEEERKNSDIKQAELQRVLGIIAAM